MSEQLLNSGPIDPKNPIYKSLLGDLQGNILSAHNCNFSAHVVIKLKADKLEEAKAWIRNFSNKMLTSEQSLLNSQDSKNNSFYGLSLSVNAYQKFAIRSPRDRVFVVTMKQINLLEIGIDMSPGDPSVSEWQLPYQENIDAILLIADNDNDLLTDITQNLVNQINSFADILTIEKGQRITNIHGQTIEPFGFVDGISQPIFYKDPADATKYAAYNPFASPSLVLVQDPNSGENAYGSFLVFRKLEQDILGFNAKITKLAEQLGDDVDEDLAAAYAMGRFKDGTPVVLHSSSSINSGEINNFNYNEDPEGSKCPFQSHTRKMNPRGDTTKLPPTGEALENERSHRIIRRTISYANSDPEQSLRQGTLFSCYQSDISNQFVFLQDAWGNRSDFIKPEVGEDPIIGNIKSESELPQGQSWPTKWGQKNFERIRFSSFVYMKGGEYLFTPSISFLKNI